MAFECAICYDALIDPEEDEQEQEYDDDDDDDDTRRPDRTPILTRCGHMYHADCLQRWLASKANARARTCPQCREKVVQRDLTVMHFHGQQEVTERAKVAANRVQRSNPPQAKKLKVETESRNGGHCRSFLCFDQAAHDALVKQYESLQEEYRQKKDQLELLRGEKASLQTLHKTQEEGILQKSKQGTKRKRGWVRSAVHSDSDVMGEGI